MPCQRATPFLFLLLLPALSPSPEGTAAADGVVPADPTPLPWPQQFHALLYSNITNLGHIRVGELWYDWPNRRNMIVMQQQLSDLLYDVEWDNGTSFYYTLGSPAGTCRTMHFPVGILRPDFLRDSTYLGRARTDGFLCDLWQKLEFIWYYEDVATRRPVRWDFYDGLSMHVMTFEPGAVLEATRCWQAPAYCFDGAGDGEDEEARSSAFADLHWRLRFLDHHTGGDPSHLLRAESLTF